MATTTPEQVKIERKRFTLDDYHRMIEAGILGRDDRVELIEGEIVEMSPIGPRHTGTLDRLNRLFTIRLGEQAIVSIQSPVTLPEVSSEPEPDLALRRPREDFYVGGHPGPADILLVIEVGDSSAGFDRHVKLPLYARAGIVEVWLVDVGARTVVAHRDPGEGAYATSVALGPDATLAPTAFPELALALADILGPTSAE